MSVKGDLVQLKAKISRGFNRVIKKTKVERLAETLKPGSPPGELPESAAYCETTMHVIAYNEKEMIEKTLEDPDEIFGFLDNWTVIWLDVVGLGNVTLLRRIGEIFNIHPLTLEDIMTLHQRPKIEVYENSVFWVVRMLERGEPITTEQLSIYLYKQCVITFQEHPGDCLDPIRKRIRESGGRVRRMKADYLAYCLVDTVVDFYFPFLDEIGERMEALERVVLERPQQSAMVALHRIKRDLLILRRSVAPLREAFNQLIRDEESIFSDITRVYLRDGYDHVIQILEFLETQRELASSLLEVYLTSVSNRTNDITKLLTIIATVFIPLSFLTGIYGMNFDVDVSPYNMPELRWRFGYLIFLCVAAIVAGLELFVFWRKGWFRSSIQTDMDKYSDKNEN